MQFSILFLPSILPLAFAAPTPVSNEPSVILKRFVESTPWHLSNIVAFDAVPGPSGVSSISFHFCDTNSGIELETECSRELAPGSGQSTIDPDTFYPCDNSTVAFQYLGSAMYIRRNYIDPSVGPCPLYCNVGAFGHSNISFVTTTSTAGTTSIQNGLAVPITSLIAK